MYDSTMGKKGINAEVEKKINVTNFCLFILALFQRINF